MSQRRFWSNPFGGLVTASTGDRSAMDEQSIAKCTSADDLINGCEKDINTLHTVAAVSDEDCAGRQREQLGNDSLETNEGDGHEKINDKLENCSIFLSYRLARAKQLLFECSLESDKDGGKGRNALLGRGGGGNHCKDFAWALAKALTTTNEQFFPKVLEDIRVIPFEARKDVVAIFNVLLTGDDLEAQDMFGQYVGKHYDNIMGPIVDVLMTFAENEIDTSSSPNAGSGGNPGGLGKSHNPDAALLCGAMYRSTLRVVTLSQTLHLLYSWSLHRKCYMWSHRHRGLYVKLLAPSSFAEKKDDEALPIKHELKSGNDNRIGPSDLNASSVEENRSCAERYLYPLLDKSVFVPNFDVASDALSTIRDVLTLDKAIASEFLQREYDVFVPKFNVMLESGSYITKRMSLKLLGELLLDRSNFHVMMRYIAHRDNLRIIMCLLRDPSGNIQFEAFHVFKIFVANPNKPPEVQSVLTQNKVKLVAYLDQFHKDREEEDEQFRDEKALLVSTLSGLEEP